MTEICPGSMRKILRRLRPPRRKYTLYLVVKRARYPISTLSSRNFCSFASFAILHDFQQKKLSFRHKNYHTVIERPPDATHNKLSISYNNTTYLQKHSQYKLQLTPKKQNRYKLQHNPKSKTNTPIQTTTFPPKSKTNPNYKEYGFFLFLALHCCRHGLIFLEWIGFC